METGSDDVKNVDLTKVHNLSGPVAVEGAEPGDCLVVDILDGTSSELAFELQIHRHDDLQSPLSRKCRGVSLYVPRSLSPNGFCQFRPLIRASLNSRKVVSSLANSIARLAKLSGISMVCAPPFTLNHNSLTITYQGVFASSRHIPGVRFAGIPHPGLIGTAPSHELLATWNKREGELIAAHGDAVPPVAYPPEPRGAYVGQDLPREVIDKVKKEGARTIPGREHGGNCDVRHLFDLA